MIFIEPHLSGLRDEFAVAATICAEESLAFRPSAAACQPLSVDQFGDKISAICDELCVDAQNGAETPSICAGRTVVRLQAAYRGSINGCKAGMSATAPIIKINIAYRTKA